MADEVGPTGSVTAVDRDLTQLMWLEDRPNVVLVKGDLATMDFGEERFDLAHSRSVFMHLAPADADASSAGWPVRCVVGARCFWRRPTGFPSTVLAPATFRRHSNRHCSRSSGAGHGRVTCRTC